MKIKIITTTNLLKWRSLEEKLQEIVKQLNRAKGAEFGVPKIHIEERKLTPVVVNGYLEQRWLNSITDPEFDKGYTFVMIHSSAKQAKEWGMEDGLWGRAHYDGKWVSEMWMGVDEKTTKRYQSGKRLNRFVNTFVHEMSHSIARGLGVEDKTHHCDYELEDVGLAIEEYDMKLYGLKTRLSYLQRVLQLLIQLKLLKK